MPLLCSCNSKIYNQVTPLLNQLNLRSLNSHAQQFIYNGSKDKVRWSFKGGSKIIIQPKILKINYHRGNSSISANWLPTSQIASSAFTLGTIAVLPFYTLMIVAPNSKLTKKTMESSIPYVALGLLYVYLLYLSWTPETLGYIFATKYWLPELPGIAKMFSNETCTSSAWIHLLTVDLFAARQVFQDGIKNKIETRHSVSLCLLSCPIGIAAHVITKALKRFSDSRPH